jgi:hypothetical protein
VVEHEVLPDDCGSGQHTIPYTDGSHLEEL